MKKINLNTGIVIFILMTFLSIISFYFFRILAFAAQGGSDLSVKLLFNFLLYIIEYMGILGLLAPVIGLLNDKNRGVKYSWKFYFISSAIITLIILALTKGIVGI